MCVCMCVCVFVYDVCRRRPAMNLCGNNTGQGSSIGIVSCKSGQVVDVDIVFLIPVRKARCDIGNIVDLKVMAFQHRGVSHSWARFFGTTTPCGAEDAAVVSLKFEVLSLRAIFGSGVTFCDRGSTCQKNNAS